MYSTIRSLTYLNDCHLHGEEMNQPSKKSLPIKKPQENQLMFLNADTNNPLHCIPSQMQPKSIVKK